MIVMITKVLLDVNKFKEFSDIYSLIFVSLLFVKYMVNIIEFQYCVNKEKREGFFNE